MNRSVMCEMIVQALSHLGSVSVETFDGDENGFVVLTKIRRGNGSVEYVVHNGWVLTSSKGAGADHLSLSSGNYFNESQYVKAECEYIDRLARV